MSAILMGLKNVSKSFSLEQGVAPILRDLTLEVKKGETLCLLGSSGCGKTTVLKILARIESPDQGELVTFQGAREVRVSYMPQAESLLPWRTIGSNIRLGLELRGWGSEEANRRVRQVLQEVGLEKEDRSFPSQLSGGMRRRVALGRAIALDCDLLLLDEPLTNLDSAARKQLGAFIQRESRRTGAAVVMVTHALDEVVQLADRVVILYGRPAKIVDDFRPASQSLDVEALQSESLLIRRLSDGLINGGMQ